jgi:hypothetical protein
MHKIKKLGLAAVSVLALAAFVGTTSASAFTVWQVDGRNVTTSTATTSSGTLQLHHFGGFGGNFTVECTGTGTGTVRSGGADTIDSIVATGCRTISGTCASPRATAINLGWSTQLSGSRDLISAGTGGRSPGWSVNCGGISASCSADTSVAIANSGANVLGTFDASSATASCTDLGTGTVTGTVTNSVTGHTLSAA